LDISGLSTNYSEVYASAANQSTAKLEGKLKNDYSQATDTELKDACNQFEAYFLEQVFKEMQKTVSITGESSDDSNAMMDYFKDKMVQEIAAQSTEKSSLGLSQMLYEQMRRNYGLDDTIKTVTE